MADLTKIRLSGQTYNIKDENALHNIDPTVTSGGTNAVQGSGIYNAITGSSAAVLEAVNTELGKKTDTSAFTAYTAATNATLANKADKSEIPTVSGYADAVAYDSTGKTMDFYHGGTGGTKVFSFDASPFLIDGMVQNVEIKDVTISGETVTCLVITFNTDAGKQEIDIPISTIFDASNYYTKDEVDAIESGINEDIAAVEARITEDEEVTAAGMNALNASLSGKQDTLIAGTGITISGNVISSSAVVTVDQTIIQNSTNAVAGGAVYDGLAAKNPMIGLDGETLVIS